MGEMEEEEGLSEILKHDNVAVQDNDNWIRNMVKSLFRTATIERLKNGEAAVMIEFKIMLKLLFRIATFCPFVVHVTQAHYFGQ